MKIIFNSDNIDYPIALGFSLLTSLMERREQRVSNFCLRALLHPRDKKLFPLSKKFTSNLHNIRIFEKYEVNFAHTLSYQNSFVPYAQL